MALGGLPRTWLIITTNFIASQAPQLKYRKDPQEKPRSPGDGKRMKSTPWNPGGEGGYFPLRKCSGCVSTWPFAHRRMSARTLAEQQTLLIRKEAVARDRLLGGASWVVGGLIGD